MADEQPPRRVGRLARWPRLQALHALIRRTLIPAERTMHRLRLQRADELLQPWPVTVPDRHPALFALAAERLAGTAEPRILSFGCSTGEEPITLARYLPQARIDGLDINPRNVAEARRKVAAAGLTRITIAEAGSPPTGPALYDAVFCLSVLRHGELDAYQPERCTAILPFRRFAETVAALDLVLKPGGYLFLWGCNFRFADTATATDYDPVPTPAMALQDGVFYGPDDLRLPIAFTREFVFRKRGGKGQDAGSGW